MTTKYPLRILSLGAGVQSTTLLRMIIHGELPPVDHAIFSDTGWEPRAVYQHLETLKAECEQAGIPLHLVSNGNIRDDALDPNKRAASMPVFLRKPDGSKAILRRQCTGEYKIKPLMNKQRELAGLKPGQRCTEHRVTTIIGISWDEAQRMKDPAFSWIQHDYPLIDARIKREDCIRWNTEHGYPPPRDRPALDARSTTTQNGEQSATIPKPGQTPSTSTSKSEQAKWRQRSRHRPDTCTKKQSRSTKSTSDPRKNAAREFCSTWNVKECADYDRDN